MDYLYLADLRLTDPARVEVFGPSSSPAECRLRFKALLTFVCKEYAADLSAPQDDRLVLLASIFDELWRACPDYYPEVMQDTLLEFVQMHSRSKPYAAPRWTDAQARLANTVIYPVLKQILERYHLNPFMALTDCLHRYKHAVMVDPGKTIHTLVNLMPVPCGQNQVLRLLTEGLLREHALADIHALRFKDDQLKKLYRVFGDAYFLGHMEKDTTLEESFVTDMGL